MIGRWSSSDIEGRPLQKSRLSGKLLSMQGFHGTICTVKESEYLVRKINGQVRQEVENAGDAPTELQRRLETIIRDLYWKDFETLIDLIFRQVGWRRVSELGKTQKTLDLDLVSPISSERYGVQIKSKAGLTAFKEYEQRFAEMKDYSRLYFVVHTPSPGLAQAETTENVELWLPKDIAQWTVEYGLTDWVISKAA